MVMREATLLLFRVNLSDLRCAETYTDPELNFITADMFTQRGHVHVFSTQQHKQANVK